MKTLVKIYNSNNITFVWNTQHTEGYNVTFVWNTQHTEGYNVTFVFIDNRETILHGKSESNHSFKDNNDMIYKIHQLHKTVNRLLLIELEHFKLKRKLTVNICHC